MPLTFDAEDRPRNRLMPLQVAAPDIEAWLLARDPRAIGRWDEIGSAEYARAFTAARTAGADVVDDLYFGIVDTISRGGTEDDFSRLVTPILRSKGWLGGDEGQIANRVRLIYDTNLRLARASGRWNRFQASKSAFPYIRAFTVGDERVRHPPKSPHADHTAWDGIILPVDHPFWTVYWPPLGFRCRCAVVQMTRSQLARYKGGITSEGDLAGRIARLGPPVFASPVAPMVDQLTTMVAGTNAERMPGAPPVDPVQTAREGVEAWEKAQAPEREFRSPINRAVNAETIKVEPRLAVQKRLSKEASEAALDSRYDPRREFADRKDDDFGRAVLNTKFSDEAASTLAALKPELDSLADQAGIPRLRGFKPIAGRSGANQGDGVMGLNPDTFNGYTSRVGGRSADSAVEVVNRKRLALSGEMTELRGRLDASEIKLAAINQAHADIRVIAERPGWREAYDEQGAILRELRKLRDKDAVLWKEKNRVARRSEEKPASPWKPGDDPKARPFSSMDYYGDGVDKLRALLFHEFGHHVHQYLNKTLRRNVRIGGVVNKNLPPLELELSRLFSASLRRLADPSRDRQLSGYTLTNEHEWFAENFSAFVMGRRDLVDPTLVELIERIFRGAF